MKHEAKMYLSGLIAVAVFGYGVLLYHFGYGESMYMICTIIALPHAIFAILLSYKEDEP